MVDTGATDCLVPRRHLESIGLVPEGQRIYQLADGSELQMDIAVVRVELMGLFVGATVIFGDTDAEPLLGVTALESAGIEVDRVQRYAQSVAVDTAQGVRQLLMLAWSCSRSLHSLRAARLGVSAVELSPAW